MPLRELARYAEIPDAAMLARELPEWLRVAGPEFVLRQRWFAGRGRAITRFEVEDLAVWPCGEGWGILAMVRLTVTPDEAMEYFLPLALQPAAAPGDIEHAALGTVRRAADHFVLRDGLASPELRQSWLAQLRQSAALAGRCGRFQWRAAARRERSGDAWTALASGLSRAIGAEQSNSSIVYLPAETGVNPKAGDAGPVIVKAYRRLQRGINPDVEITEFLTERTRFTHCAPWLGGLEYHPHQAAAADDAMRTLALAQEFIPGADDGWSFILARLAAAAAGTPEALESAALPEITLLGRITAELHRALASGGSLPEFAPQPWRQPDDEAWREQCRALRDEVGAVFAAQRAQLPQPLRERAGIMLAEMRGSHPWPAGMAELIETTDAIRIHGDYHLGQVLWTDGSFIVLDFEGEPARSLAARRRRQPALKDVAGMLRSFDYAEQAALRALTEPARSALSPHLSAWRRRARLCFWSAWLDGVHESPARLAPADPRAARAALDALEWEKAVYELGYELRYRPDWVEIPLAGLERLVAERGRNETPI